MSLNQITVIDLIQVMPITGQLQIRQENQIQDSSNNNAIVASSYSRYVLNPGDDITTQTSLVQSIANLIWTPTIISNWQELQKKGNTI